MLIAVATITMLVGPDSEESVPVVEAAEDSPGAIVDDGEHRASENEPKLTPAPDASIPAPSAPPRAEVPLEPMRPQAVDMRAELLASRLFTEPAFSGKGLLVGAGVSLGVAVGSGIALAFINQNSREECHDWGFGLECYLEPRSYEAQEAAIALLVLGSVSSVGLSVAGGLLRGRHDAWATWAGARERVHARPLLTAGSALLAAGTGLAVATGAVAFAYWNPSRALSTALPVMATAAVASMTVGGGMLAYSGMYTRRLRRIEWLSTRPLFAANRTFGLGLAGGF
jgi:hypothetical protein